LFSSFLFCVSLLRSICFGSGESLFLHDFFHRSKTTDVKQNGNQ
jgi:hypothetical protein